MFQVANLTKQHPPDGGPKLPWKKIKEKILGKKYELSLVFAPDSLMKKLNKIYRHKDKAASVLSFDLSREQDREQALLRQGFAGQGEIFINLDQKKHPPLYLFIHALLHLKGFKHSARMEREEKKLMEKYSYGAGCGYRA